MREVTNRQKEVLSFISDFTEDNSFPPTVREIGERGREREARDREREREKRRCR